MSEISIVVPVHNTGNPLRETLNSIMGQTFYDYEVICVDDYSRDAVTCDVLHYFNKKYERFNLIRTKRSVGAAEARNIGLDKACGKYIIFLDSDDLFDINFLDEMYKKLKENKSDICICGYTAINSINNEELFSYKPSQYDIDNRTDERWLRYIPSSPWTKLCNRDFLIDHGIRFQNITSCNDVFYSFMAVGKSCKTSVLENERYIRYRTGIRGQISEKRNPYNAYLAHKALLDASINDLFTKQIACSMIETMIAEISNDPFSDKSIELCFTVREYLSESGIIFRNQLLEIIKDRLISKTIEDFYNWYQSLKSNYIQQFELVANYLHGVIDGKKIIVWGLGRRGASFIEFCEKHDIDIEGVFDSDSKKLKNKPWKVISDIREHIDGINKVIIASNRHIYHCAQMMDKSIKVLNAENLSFID